MVTYIHKYVSEWEKKQAKKESAKQCITTVSDISKQNAYLSINIDNLIRKLKTKFVYMHNIAFGKTCVTRKKINEQSLKQINSSHHIWVENQYGNTVRCLTYL